MAMHLMSANLCPALLELAYAERWQLWLEF